MRDKVGWSDEKPYDTVLEAFVHSSWGEEMWKLHKHGEVHLVESQAEMTPLQRRFLLLAADVHEPDEPDQMSGISSPNRKTSTHTRSENIF